MSAKLIVRRSRASRRGKTDWARVDALTDAEIEEAVRNDPDAPPIVDAEWFAKATLVMPERKVPISLRLDRDVLEWFKSRGPRYQSRMNAVLKAYAREHQASESNRRSGARGGT